MKVCVVLRGLLRCFGHGLAQKHWPMSCDLLEKWIEFDYIRVYARTTGRAVPRKAKGQ